MTDINCVEQIEELLLEQGADPKKIKKYVDEAVRIKASAKDQGEYIKYMQEFFNQTKEDRIVARAQKLDSVNKLVKSLEFIKQDAFKGEPDVAFRGLMTGVDRLSHGGNYSIESKTKAFVAEHANRFKRELIKEDLAEVMMEGKLDKEIAIELFEMDVDGGKIGKSGSLYAQKAASIINTLYKGMVKQLNLSGAQIRELKGRVARNSHDPELVRKVGFEKWKKDIENKLEVEKTFGVNKNDQAKMDEFLLETYNSIIADVIKIGPGTSGKRSIHFTSGEDWFEYNKSYGKATLMETVLSEIESNSRRYGRVDTLGHDPEKFFDKLKTAIQDSIKNDPKAQQAWRNNYADIEKEFRGEVLGAHSRPGHSLGAKLGAGTRAVTNMSKLGTSLTASFTDWATSAMSIVNSSGKNYFQAQGEVFAEYFKNLKPSKRKENAMMLSLYTESVLGDLFDKFGAGASDNAPGIINKMQNTFFSLTGLKAHTEMGKTGTATILSRDLGKYSKKNFSSLTKRQRANIERFEINHKEWDIIRQGTMTFNGSTLLTPDRIRELPIEKFEALAKEMRIDPEKLKMELSNKVSAYLTDMTEQGVVTVSGRERTTMFGGTSADEDQLRRFIWQYKSFPLAMYRVFKRGAMSDPDKEAKTMMDLLKGKGDNKAMVTMMLSTTAMAYVGMSARAITKNKIPPDPTDPKTWMEAFIKGGSLGLGADFLFGEYDKHYRSPSKDILGPVIGGTIDDALTLWASAKKGEAKASKAFNLMLQNTPFQNLLVARTAMDYLFLNEIQETLNPGWMARQQANAEKQGQGPLF